jgi:hypothetical protein
MLEIRLQDDQDDQHDQGNQDDQDDQLFIVWFLHAWVAVPWFKMW